MHRVSLKRPYEIPGAPVLAEGSGPQGDRVMSEAGILLADEVGMAAEFARSSRRGLRRVRDLVPGRGQGCAKELDQRTDCSRQMPDAPYSIKETTLVLFVTFLACPGKVTQRRAPRGPSGPSCSVALGTFRKLALRAQTVRNVSPSGSVA